MARQGFFVSFEGIDGSGKTTQIDLLASRLRERGHFPVLTQEPGGTRVGRMIRRILLDSANTDLDPTTELLLYFASRVQNLAEVILPALARGKVVICDRFTDATVAYQGYGRALGACRIRELDQFACDGVQPDLTLWLDVEPGVAVGRARDRNVGRSVDEGRMEAQSMRFFEAVRRAYADIHAREPERVRRIDANGSPEQVAHEVQAVALKALEARGLEPV